MKMNKLLIAYYWYPWNSWGTFRWWNFAKYIDMDILTSKKPKGAFYDPTIEKRGQKIYRTGSFFATLWGLYIIGPLLFHIRKYKILIFTSPPETLIILAWLCQVLGKVVLLDMRDGINNPIKPQLKLARPVFRFFYKRIKHKTVCWNFLREGDEKVIRHGYYEELVKYDGELWSAGLTPKKPFKHWLHDIQSGSLNNYYKKPKGYGSSSFVNYLYLGFKDLPIHFHGEVHCQIPYSWREQATKMEDVINAIDKSGEKTTKKQKQEDVDERDN